MNNTELKQCPFCGQFMLCEEERDIRECCTCDGAKKYHARTNTYQSMSAQLKKLCGEGCDEDSETPERIRAVFKPVSEEAYKLLDDILHAVIFRQIGKTSVVLADGTILIISPESITRKANIKNKMG